MSAEEHDSPGLLAAFSKQLAEAVASAGASVVRVEARRRRAASGIIWGQSDLVLTADHVVERDEDLAIGLPDGGTADASIVGRDPGTDLALLRVSGHDTPAISLGATPEVGHVALAVARPGSSLATSIGVVSAWGGPTRTRRGGQLKGVIWTDATLYPGFSGGALVDTGGRMVGLTTSRYGSGAGLAIPLETIERVAASLLQHGHIKRAFLGVSSQTVRLPTRLRGQLSVEQHSGLLVVGLAADGPAERDGLMLGDVLIGFDDTSIETTDDLVNQLGPSRVGQAATLRLIRGGAARDVSVTVGEWE